MPLTWPAWKPRAIAIIREVAAAFRKPVMLYSIGKDSGVMLHLALKAFYPGKPPFPLLHVDTTWKFRDMIAFRDETARRLGLELIVHVNEEGLRRGINPIASGSALHTQVMKTEALKQALDRHGFDAAFGGARRDEEKSRAKERIFSFRTANHGWDPRDQRPELWDLFNTRIRPGESIRVFPLSNWTEHDVWDYVLAERLPVVPLYLAKPSGRWCAAPAPGSWWTTTACRSARGSGRRCARCASARSAATRSPARWRAPPTRWKRSWPRCAPRAPASARAA